MKKKLISIIVPAYNEQENIVLFWNAISKQLNKLRKYDFELVFVDDGSTDKTLAEINKLQKKDKRIRAVELVRNWGKEAATTAGLHYAKGDAVIMIDADLQHPIEEIPNFIKLWQNGAEVVTGVRKDNSHVSRFKAFRSNLYYKILNKIADVELVPYSTDFQLLDRLVVEEFNRLTERNRITRGLISWLGFKTEYLYFKANNRVTGDASYNTFQLFRLAINSFISLSLFPLKLTGYMGIVISLLAAAMGTFMVIERFALGDPFNMKFSGTSILAVMTLFLVGIILSSLGLIALYIGSIHGEVINRPLYVVRQRKGKP